MSFIQRTRLQESREDRALMRLCIAGDRMFNEAQAQLEATPGDTPSIEEINESQVPVRQCEKDIDDLLTFNGRVARFDQY